jgi:hypothetical protein
MLAEGLGGGRKPLTDEFRDRGRGFNVLSVDRGGNQPELLDGEG